MTRKLRFRAVMCCNSIKQHEKLHTTEAYRYLCINASARILSAAMEAAVNSCLFYFLSIIIIQVNNKLIVQRYALFFMKRSLFYSQTSILFTKITFNKHLLSCQFFCVQFDVVEKAKKMIVNIIC